MGSLHKDAHACCSDDRIFPKICRSLLPLERRTGTWEPTNMKSNNKRVLSTGGILMAPCCTLLERKKDRKKAMNDKKEREKDRI